MQYDSVLLFIIHYSIILVGNIFPLFSNVLINIIHIFYCVIFETSMILFSNILCNDEMIMCLFNNWYSIEKCVASNEAILVFNVYWPIEMTMIIYCMKYYSVYYSI